MAAPEDHFCSGVCSTAFPLVHRSDSMQCVNGERKVCSNQVKKMKNNRKNMKKKKMMKNGLATIPTPPQYLLLT